MTARTNLPEYNVWESMLMDGTPTQGPAVTFTKSNKPYDFSRFDVLLAGLQDWRSDDHEDNITLCRSHVIEIIEGVKALRR